MCNNNLEEILGALPKIQDNSKLLKALIDLRKLVEWPKNRDNITRLCDKGGLKPIIVSLQTSKKSIVDVSLSILGNCCLDARCTRDAVELFNVLPALNQTLKRYPKEDSVNGRIFRIIGNICQHKDKFANVIIDKKPQIIIHTVTFLKNATHSNDNKVSEATIVMGIRALRLILNGGTLKMLVKTHGVLGAIGMVLIKYGRTWEEKKEGENVLNNIVKLLQEYSRYRYYPSIEEMRKTDQGDSIVYLSKILPLAPMQIVKIIMNFLRISQLKSDLPVPEIFNSFIDVLRNDAIIKEFNKTCEECVKCLCHLLEHPGNRNNERCGDSIPILISVLRDLTLHSNMKIEICILIISTLNKCRYNETLIVDQIKHNILEVLGEKLYELVGEVEPLSVAHKSDKKRSNQFITSLSKAKRNRLTMEEDCGAFVLSGGEELSDYDSDDVFYPGSMRCDYSPASSNESEPAVSWTSGLSPESSPWSYSYRISGSDSDDYSPVCSEVDSSDFPLPLLDGADSPLNTEEIPEELEELTSLVDNAADNKQVKGKLVIEIVDLLKVYIKLKPPILQLGNPKLLLQLMKSSGYFEWPHSYEINDISDVIHKILETHEYLIPLMQSDFIPVMYDLSTSKLQHGLWCSKCRQFQRISGFMIRALSRLAETGAGKGDIAHRLLRGDSRIKQQLVLVIPYIVRNRGILVKLMLNCGGLDILMRLLQEVSENQEKSIKVLCALASKKLGIPNPKKVKGVYRKELTGVGTGTTSNLVTFQLDDGSSLEADRGLLTQHSEFFGRLFNGSFKESMEDVISLPNVENKSFKCLLHLIQSDIDNGIVEFNLDLDTHLDVIALCDRFLMTDHCAYLTDYVEKFRLSANTIPTIYHWSLMSRTNLLRVECIAFALVGNIADCERFAMFKGLFELGLNDELVEDIKKLLVRYLTLNRFCQCRSECRCDIKV